MYDNPQRVKPKTDAPASCLLCRQRNDFRKGSHLAPNTLIQQFFSIDGSSTRGKEIAKEHIAAELKERKFWGSAVQPEEIDETFGKVNPVISYLFWVSVFWRLSIADMCVRLSEADEEQMRLILDRNLPDTPKGLTDLKSTDLNDESSNISDVVKGENAWEIKILVGNSLDKITLDEVKQTGEMGTVTHPGAIARMLAWTKQHRHLSIEEQCEGIKKDLGYTYEESDYLYKWFWTHYGAGKIKSRN